MIARYHIRSNNTSPKWTLREVFGTDNVIPTIDLPSHLDALSRRNVVQIMADEWINRHTFYTYYAPFLPDSLAIRVKALMRSTDGSGIHALVGITASTIDQTNRLWFCPSCYEQDIQRYGEPYWHRIHQLPGVYLCPHHRRVLHELTSPLSDRHGLNVLPISRHMFRSIAVIEDLPNKLIDRLSDIAEDIHLLVQQNKLPALYDLRKAILPRLTEKGFVTVLSRIRQQKLCEQPVLFYGRELLDLLDSDPLEVRYSWLEQSTRTARRAVHPLRQLLLIRFLYGSFREFLNRTDVTNAPFGNAPWPCLNKAADHYKNLVVTQCDITRCSDTGQPVGTFVCSCGFSYSRRGPDRSEEEKYYRGRIKSFGPIWSDKLKQCMQEGMSYRSTAERLGVDTNTVIKYANGKSPVREVPLKPKHAKKSGTAPTPKNTRKSPRMRVDWEKRDLELSWNVEQVCKAI
nr:TnsD family Tn7-like transposition protein [Paenibacillus algicola]